MTKFLEQPEKQEPPVLAMARQVLGRVKEMDLTPEQHKILNDSIDEAVKAEKVGDTLKAVKIYQELKDLVSVWKKDKRLKDKQSEKIKELAEETDKDYVDNSLVRNNILKMLEEQKIIIALPENKKSQVIANEDFQARESDGPIQSEQIIMDKFYQFCPEVEPEDFFVIQKVINERGDLISLELGVVGLDYHYDYRLGGSGKVSGPLHTIISKYKPGKDIWIAEYKNGKWEKVDNDEN